MGLEGGGGIYIIGVVIEIVFVVTRSIILCVMAVLRGS